jgi:cysteine desulfurase/selenocysteine lyase
MSSDPIKEAFPIFANNPQMVYLDNAATTQKPQSVLDAVNEYYTQYCSNTHRGMHDLGNHATRMYEDARAEVAGFIEAETREIIFTKGTTEAINLVASSFVRDRFEHVIVTTLEHHSNIIPWQLLGFVEGDGLSAVPLDEHRNVDMGAYEALLRQFPGSFVSLVHVSNVFGIIVPVKEMIALAHRYGCVVLVDGAQAVAHMSVDVKELGADFYAFSGHKMYGPTGIGALYGRYDLLDGMGPYHGGGTMIDTVSFANSTFLNPPHRFEAGTQPIAQAIGFAEAVRFVHLQGYEKIRAHDDILMLYAKRALQRIDGLIRYTDAQNVAGNLSFNVEGVHHSDIGTLLDKQHVFLRTGHHCAMPLMRAVGIDGTVRLSFAIYNETEDIDKTVTALEKALRMLR